MRSLVKMIATNILLFANTTIGLLPLLAGISVTLMALVGLVLHGLRRMQRSEGLAPSRVEQPYEGPALSWTPNSQPARKLVRHDALGLSSDLDWLNNRGETPASLAPQQNSYEPIEAPVIAAKVFATNLPPPAPAGKNARREKNGAQLPAAERLAALKNSIPAPQPRAAVTSPSGRPPRTAVLRALDSHAAVPASPSANVSVQVAAPVAGPAPAAGDSAAPEVSANAVVRS
jgi:hypothetical protein